MGSRTRCGALAAAFVVLIVCCVTVADAYAYFPGMIETTYNKSDLVYANVNSLRSLSTLAPRDYYYLPFCAPRKVLSKPESLGEIIWGDRIVSSLYIFRMLEDSKCTLLPCSNVTENNIAVRQQADKFETMINQGYRAYMSIDNLPVFSNRSGEPIFGGRCTGELPLEQRLKNSRGYSIGISKLCNGSTMLNNHLAFTITVHPYDEGNGNVRYSVVGFTQEPFTVRHALDGSDCNEAFNPTAVDIDPLTIDAIRAGYPVWWSYSVKWVVRSDIRWTTRWDAYLSTSVADTDNSVHIVHIVLSLLIGGCLSLIATTMLMRALHKDFNRYNSPDPDENQEEVGWKLVHSDVFRTPVHSHVFAGLIGNGVQILFMCLTTLGFALLGVLSPANRGALLTTLLLLFVLMSFVSGFVCGHLLKIFERREWKWVILCGGMFPGVVFLIFVFTNFVNISAHATTAVPALQFFMIFAMWFAISLPLTVLGASFAFHQASIEHPIKVGKLAREIPLQRWYFSAPFIYLVPPMIPLGVIFAELKFILSAVWLNRVYYVFGFLAVAFLLWIYVCALTAVIATYYQLCYENYQWWWSSVFVPGGFGLQIFVYLTYYYFTVLDITTVTGTMIYFSYMGLLSVAYGVVSGAVGFIACMLFVRKIYSSIKLD